MFQGGGARGMVASTSTPSTRRRLGGLAVLVFTARRQAEAS